MKKILIVVSIIFGMLVFRFSLDTFDTFLDANSINIGLSSDTNVTELFISGYNDESGRMIINDIINFVETEDLDVIISVMKDNSEDFYRYLHLDMENKYIPLNKGVITNLTDFDLYSTKSKDKSKQIYNPLSNPGELIYLPVNELRDIHISKITSFTFITSDSVKEVISLLAEKYSTVEFNFYEDQSQVFEFQYFTTENIEILIAAALFLTFIIVAFINRETKRISAYKIEGHSLRYLYKNVILDNIIISIAVQILSILLASFIIVPLHVNKLILFKSILIYFVSLNLFIVLISLITLILIYLVPNNLSIKGKDYLNSVELVLRGFKISFAVFFTFSILIGLNETSKYIDVIVNDKQVIQAYDGVYALDSFLKPNIDIYQTEEGFNLQTKLEENENMFMFNHRYTDIGEDLVDVYYVTPNYFKINDYPFSNNTIISKNESSISEYCNGQYGREILDDKYCDEFEKVISDTNFVNYLYSIDEGLYLDDSAVIVISNHSEFDIFVNRFIKPISEDNVQINLDKLHSEFSLESIAVATPLVSQYESIKYYHLRQIITPIMFSIILIMIYVLISLETNSLRIDRKRQQLKLFSTEGYSLLILTLLLSVNNLIDLIIILILSFIFKSASIVIIVWTLGLFIEGLYIFNKIKRLDRRI